MVVVLKYIEMFYFVTENSGKTYCEFLFYSYLLGEMHEK